MKETKGILSPLQNLDNRLRLAIYALGGAAVKTVLMTISAGLHLDYLIMASPMGALCGLAGWVGWRRAEERQAKKSTLPYPR